MCGFQSIVLVLLHWRGGEAGDVLRLVVVADGGACLHLSIPLTGFGSASLS